MRYFFFLAFITIGCMPAWAETILFESATLGQTDIPISDLSNGIVPGTNINQHVYIGVRFQLTEPVITSKVGGHFVSGRESTFFGAIVSLDDESDFTDSVDFSTPDFRGSTLLMSPVTSRQVFGELSLALDPGWYALIFGAGLFGAEGGGAAVRNGVDLDDPSYFVMTPGAPNIGNNITSFPNHRFVLTGTKLPEQSTLFFAILSSGICLLTRMVH